MALRVIRRLCFTYMRCECVLIIELHRLYERNQMDGSTLTAGLQLPVVR